VILPSLPGQWRLQGDGFEAVQLRLPAPHLFIREASAYLFSAGGEHLLVDTGPREEPAWSALVGALAERGLTPADIGTVLVTHAHPDHYGSAERFQAGGAEVLVHRLDLEFHRRRAAEPERYVEGLAGWLARQGVPDAERGAWLAQRSRAAGIGGPALRPDRLVEGGEELRLGPLRLRLEWTPGHTPGHIIAWEDRHGFVLLGDHVLPTASPNVGIDHEVRGNPLSGYLDSLRRLADRPDVAALPGHGHRFDLVARVRELLAHQEDRAARVLEAIRGGARTAYEVRPRIWDDPTWEGLKGGLRVNAIRTLAAQLARLESLGLVVRHADDRADRYEPVLPAEPAAGRRSIALARGAVPDEHD
jgi:glyoxylase-like metal-dependent hydrolase (beta-lactamase superfamily II)